VATELTRGGYVVTFTLGNALQSDLVVAISTGKGFTLEIKPQSTKNFWRFREPKVSEDSFYIFVFIPEDFEPLKSYIMTSHEVYTKYHAYKKETLERKPDVVDSHWGINWITVFPHENKWG
jgi:hypothetical protein